MEENSMKNIIVLKDLPSNIIEEAIVILKQNAIIKNIDKKESVKITLGGKKSSRDYIIKEAESVVASYISSIEKPKQLEISNKKIKKKYKNLQKLTAFFAIVAILGIIVNFI